MTGILAVSLVLQIAAVALAVRWSRVYRLHRAWWVIAVALLFMAVRRAADFYEFLAEAEAGSPSLVSELLALNVSVLLVAGLWLLGPFFQRMQDAEVRLKSWPTETNGLTRPTPADLAERDLSAIYHSLVETLPLSIIRKDRAGRFVFLNSAACRMLNRRREEVLNKSDGDLFEPALAQKYQRDDRQVLETGQAIEDVEEFRDPDGELRQVQILKTPVIDSQQRIVGTQVIFWDVTERRQAVEALARNEAIKTAMFEAALDSIITIDNAGRILEFNSAAERTFGYDRQEVLGQDMATLLMAESARQRHRANLAHYLGSGEAGSLMIGRLAIPMERKDKSQFTAELSMQPIPLDQSTGFTIFLRDITERQRVEQELARQRKLIEETNIHLKQEVQERRRAEDETRLRNRDLKTLLYVISHDLREPLRAIRNFASLIHDRYADCLDDKGRDFLGRILRGADRLDQQLEDVLMLSRAQRLIAPEDEVPLREVVADVLKRLEMRIQETRAVLAIEDNLPTVRADRAWAVQAVFNLVSNALKFTEPGRPPEISIRGFESNGKCPDQRGLVVADRGPGVPPGHAERIFDLFQRAVGRDIAGTGAGLSIVRRIAERHGGQVWHQPRPGGGAEFWLSFGIPPERRKHKTPQ